KYGLRRRAAGIGQHGVANRTDGHGVALITSGIFAGKAGCDGRQVGLRLTLRDVGAVPPHGEEYRLTALVEGVPHLCGPDSLRSLGGEPEVRTEDGIHADEALGRDPDYG